MLKVFKRQFRKRKRRQQSRINTILKKKLFGHLVFSICYYCKVVFLLDHLTIEHVIPLCLGGNNDPTNIALACKPCNHERGKISWLQKRQINKKYYEQYYP